MDLRAIVQTVVNEHDPLRLLELGCPDDEYAPEINDITQRLQNGETMTPEALKAIWERWFYEGCCDDQVYESMATALVSRMPVH